MKRTVCRYSSYRNTFHHDHDHDQDHNHDVTGRWASSGSRTATRDTYEE
ncbi:hypothetical protein ACFZAE_17960 [Streptomyces scabiei]